VLDDGVWVGDGLLKNAISLPNEMNTVLAESNRPGRRAFMLLWHSDALFQKLFNIPARYSSIRCFNKKTRKPPKLPGLISHRGNPAVCMRSVAFRPCLATSLAFPGDPPKCPLSALGCILRHCGVLEYASFLRICPPGQRTFCEAAVIDPSAKLLPPGSPHVNPCRPHVNPM